MRLGQLSRKIGVQQSRISTFLEEKNYTLEAGSNSKLTEEQEQLIKTHFDYVEEEATLVADILHTDAPATDTLDSNAPVVDILKKEATPVANILNEEEDAAASDTSTEEIVENGAPELVEESTTVTDLPKEIVPSTEETTDEVIRAPKLKLDGLKVVGKIDLPEPKIKEEAATAADSTETKEEAATVADSPQKKGTANDSEEIKEKPVRKKINQRGSQNRRPERRILTLAEKREREERTKKKLEKERKEEEKQFRAAYYESKMRERKPVAAKKKKRKANIQEEQRPEEITPAPTTLVGKFLKWLNT